MFRRALIILSLISIALVFILLTTTTPATIGPLGLLLIFVCSYIAIVGICSFLIYGLTRAAGSTVSTFKLGRRLSPISFRQAYYYSTVIGAAPVMLVGLASVGAVGIYESILVLVFVGLGCLYVAKMIR